MHLSKLFMLTLILPAMILSYTDYLKDSGPVQLSGTVVESVSGKPVEKVHVYIIEGTEEILTNQKGEFTLSTWQKLPVSVTVAHSQYITETVRINSASENLKITIRKK